MVGTYHNSTKNMDTTIDVLSSYAISTPIREGYRFKGWTLTHTANATIASEDNYYQVAKSNIEGDLEENGTLYTAGNMNATLTANWDKINTLTIHAIDENGKVLQTTSNKVYEGDSYFTTAPEIANYTKVSSSNNTYGIAEATDIVVNYYYASNSCVKVKYLELGTNEVVAEEEIIHGYIGKEYQAKEKMIANYTVVKMDATTKGTMTRDTIEVTYYYIQNATALVKYVDYYTGDVLETTIMEGLVGDMVTPSPAEIKGYALIESPTNTEYVLQKEPIEIIYYYSMHTNVTVKYIDQITGNLLDSVLIEGYEGKDYVTEEKKISNYRFVEVIGNTTGKMIKTPIEVSYYYAYQSSLEVQYIDYHTGKVLDRVTKEGKEGDQVTVLPMEIEGYQLYEKPKVETYTLSKTNQIVTYYYIAISEGVLVNYVDANTNDLLEQLTIKGCEGDNYTTENKSFDGYDFKYATDNTTGEMKQNLIEVTYYYQYRSSYTVNYMDQYSNEIIKTSTITGHEGDAYSVTYESIDGYQLNKENLPNNETGILNKKETIINYYLIQKSQGVMIQHIDQATGKEIAEEETIEGYEGDSYVTNPKRIEGYTLVATGENTSGTMKKEKITMVYYYLKDCSVIVNYVDQTTNTILKTITINGQETYPYQTEIKDFDGYNCDKSCYPDNSKGIFRIEPIIVNYYYTQLKFNIAVGQELSSIMLNGKEDKVGNSLTISRKTDIHSLKFTYIIMVSNDSELAGSTVLYDYIPNGYVARQQDNPDWTIDGNVAYRKVNNLVMGESRQFRIVLTATSSEVAGTIVNKTSAVDSVCKPGFSEMILEDNNDENEFVISISTGLTQHIKEIVWGALMILIVIGLFVLKIRKMHKDTKSEI